VVKVGADQRAERVQVKAGVADGDWIAVDGTLRPGDRIVVRGGETLRGKEKLDIVGVFEAETRSVTADRSQPMA
jgi:multidrug efflux pump subunit AcrA (membrane-fusion protein)